MIHKIEQIKIIINKYNKKLEIKLNRNNMIIYKIIF